MGLFNKKLSLDELWKGIQALSDEEKKLLREKLQGENETETEEPVEEIEETGENETAYGNEQAATGENEEASAAEEAAKPFEETPEQTAEPSEEITEETVQTDEQAQENYGEMIKGLTDRVSAMEESLKGLNELKAMMEEFTQKQADSFGYKGQIPGAKKDIREMSADELKSSIIKGI